MKHNWIYISLVAALVIAVVMLWEEQPRILNPFGAEGPETRFPYAVIEDAHSKHFDSEGKLSYEFIATTLRHFRLDLRRVSENDYTNLESPKLTLHTDDGDPWYVTAEQGELSERGTLLKLWPNVRIWQEDSSGQQLTELTTTHLEIRPREKIISTDAEVSISSPQGRLDAKGMIVDLENKRIELLNRVRGYHEPIANTPAP